MRFVVNHDLRPADYDGSFWPKRLYKKRGGELKKAHNADIFASNSVQERKKCCKIGT